VPSLLLAGESALPCVAPLLDRLGYYVCNDCCGNPASPHTYRDLKYLDPYHLTFGAVNCPDIWQYSDGEIGSASLSLDVPLIENFETGMVQVASTVGSDMQAISTLMNAVFHAIPTQFERHCNAVWQMHTWPMGWNPIINCPWGSDSNEHYENRNPYSAGQMRTLTYIGLLQATTGVSSLK
jgi:hypothetical protein